jgi:hypothetical protein
MLLLYDGYRARGRGADYLEAADGSDGDRVNLAFGGSVCLTRLGTTEPGLST